MTDSNVSERLITSRVVEAAIWGIPGVNSQAMLEAFTTAVGGGPNQLLFWPRPSDWTNQSLTPNTDALYLMPFYDTSETGPLVLEIPPADDGSIVGSVMDLWQTPLDEVGPAGRDAGQGGKYLLTPPGYKDTIPEGYLLLPSETFQGYALLRSIPASNSAADLDAAVAYMKRVRLYPLATDADGPSADAPFVDGTGVIFDSTIPYDLRFFQSLDRIVQKEPWIDRDRRMIDLLASIGIRKGQPFAPNREHAERLLAGLADAREWLDQQYESFSPFFPGTHWFLPGDPDLMRSWAVSWGDPDHYPADARGVIYYWGFSSLKHAGTGGHQLYTFTTRDNNGDPLHGADSHTLAVPPNVPAAQYWSVTAYDRATHALIREVPVASRSSLESGLAAADDGTVTIYFAPTAPDGFEGNWIPTRPDKDFELIFRFYGVEKAVGDGTWALPDVQTAGARS
ncbi:DUF1254 domain-containing protein [Herbiconiux daphne]|uniref:DUF1254 domain-containing protein n=1 Tax=Herbiconiux daphne TaxID=2970914 RepID=A0ABT2GWX4_9MICO|nr:DUF1254 domain-containing protein [Herbiconiux daphne]MCS5732459.1 DUF1254 domain-containing protein [Herbiconiux daphne]